ncbi:YBL095W [Zygosaccharomyces parabailii]|nr:YBL095W [Zygosaccharomyces parabailii]
MWECTRGSGKNAGFAYQGANDMEPPGLKVLQRAKPPAERSVPVSRLGTTYKSGPRAPEGREGVTFTIPTSTRTHIQTNKYLLTYRDMFSAVNRVVLLPIAGLTLGTLGFLRTWPDVDHKTLKTDPEVVERWQRTPTYRELGLWPHTSRLSEAIPAAHRANHVGQGLLSGRGKLENDPLIFRDEERGELAAVYQLGPELADSNGHVYPGVLSIMLDEALCYCGFPKLPHGHGVTAKLDLQFERPVPAGSLVVLRASVVESRGRKCVIGGRLESIPGMEQGVGGWLRSILGRSQVYARGECVLVEPRWFKWMKWV